MMGLNISKKIDILFEIPYLISACKDIEETKMQYIKELDAFGINGDAYYNSNLKILDKYMKSFKKHMVLEEQDSFFSAKDDPYARILFVCILLGNKKIYEDIDSFTDDELRLNLIQMHNEIYEDKLPLEVTSLDDILLLLGDKDMSEEVKWKFILIFKDPRKYYSMYIELVNKNIPAFEKAYSSVEKYLEPLWNKYMLYIEEDKHNLIKPLNSSNQECFILPSIIAIGLINVSNTTIYVGLFFEDLYDTQFNALENKGSIVHKLKSIADKTKIDILLLLKSGPKYSLEIAEMLKLTPATVSYHMSNLHKCSIVKLKKHEGKSYYSINEKMTRSLIRDLENLLLN